MCLSSTPKYTPPPPPQEAKTPDAGTGEARRRANANGMAAAGSTLLTGASGIESSALKLGKSSLLGG